MCNERILAGVQSRLLSDPVVFFFVVLLFSQVANMTTNQYDHQAAL